MNFRYLHMLRWCLTWMRLQFLLTNHRAFLLPCAPGLLKQDCIALIWIAYPPIRYLWEVVLLDIKDAEGRQRVNRVTVFVRPGLHEFLQLTSEFADLLLFTAGLEGYAKPLVDRMDAHNRFYLRLYRSSTVTSQYREHVKDLSCLSKDFHRIVLVDNNPYSFLLQPLNGIPFVTFSAAQPVDDQLMGAIFPLLKHLSLENDVRPALYEIFHMPEWFQRQGIPPVDEVVLV